jgi:hypothetical protein
MIEKEIDKIKEENLQVLIDNSVFEAKTIEYKRELPPKLDKEKKIEFLADVSSFANAGGGDLIYGITAENGIPKSLDGLIIDDIDGEILRLENMIRTGIEPRIPAVRTQPVPLKNSNVAVVIRIPKSWISPHRVKHNDKFYSRSSNGKYPLDVSELRITFNLSETITERIRNFRLDRIAKIFANETPVPFYNGAKILLHLVPVTSFNPAQNYDITKVASQPIIMPPIHAFGWDGRYNLDGFLNYSKDQVGKSHSYVQFFRNGIIEAVEGALLNTNSGKLYIGYEQELINSLGGYLSRLKTLNVELPIFVFLTLLGVKGYSMGVNKWDYDIEEVQTIDRDILLLPEVIVENYDGKAEKVLKPCFDSIWNACGFPRSFNYNDKGEWAPAK